MTKCYDDRHPIVDAGHDVTIHVRDNSVAVNDRRKEDDRRERDDDRRRDEQGEETLHPGNFSAHVLGDGTLEIKHGDNRYEYDVRIGRDRRLQLSPRHTADRRRDEKHEEERKERERSEDRKRDKRRDGAQTTDCDPTKKVGDVASQVGQGGSGRMNSRPDILKAIEEETARQHPAFKRAS
jgi:hypothetical protein